MATINELLIKLEADTTQLRRAFDQAEKQVDGSARKMEQSIRRTDTAVAALGNALKSLAPALAVGAAFTALGQAITQGFRDASEADRVYRRLEATLRATGGAAGLTAAQIKLFADQQEASTLATSEAIQEAAAILSTFRSVSGETFIDTIKLAQDLSTVFGQDLRSSATQLGKALADPAQGLTALRRVGVSFTEAQKQLIESLVETGDKAQAQRIILAELEKQVGGAAAAEGGAGLTGAVNALSDVWGNFVEELVKGTGAYDTAIQAVNLLKRAVEGLGALALPNISEQIVKANNELIAAEDELARRQTGPLSGTMRGQQLIADQERRVKELRAQVETLIQRARAEAQAFGGDASAPTNDNTPPDSAKANDVIKALELERANLSRTSEEQAVYNALAKAGVDIKTAQGQRIAELVRQIQAEKTEREGLVDAAKREIAAVKEAEQAEQAYREELNNRIGKQREIKESLDDEIAANEALIDALKKGGDAYQRQAEFQAALNRYKAAGIELTEQEIEALRRQTDTLGTQEKQLDDLKRRNDEYKRAQADFTRTIGTAFEDAVLAGEELSDVLKALEKDIARIIFRLTVTKPLENALTDLLGGGGGSGGGGGGGLGSLFPNIFGIGTGNTGNDFGTGAAFGNLDFGGFFADGGRPPVGMPSVVGERGPELFVPDRAGTIVSNDNLGRMGGGSVVVNQSFNFSGDMTATARAEALKLMPAFQASTIAAIEARQRRGVRA